MFGVSNQYKKSIKEPSRTFKSLILINNNVYSDSEILNINYEENLFMESEFSIGSAIMTTVEIELRNTQSIIDDFKEGNEFEVKLGIEVDSHKYEFIPLGLFIIEDVGKSIFSIKIYANDRMIHFEKDYLSELIFPATLGDIALDISNKAGIKLKTHTFVNSDYLVPIKPDLTDVTLRTALMHIAELAGGYARISRDGYLEIFNIDVNISNNFNYASESFYSNKTISDELNWFDSNTVTDDNFITFSNKTFTVSSIDKLIIDTQGVKEELGDGKNVYYIVDNLFCNNPSKIIKNIYDILSKISYVPYDIKLQGDPSLQSGDNITIKQRNGAIINTLITNRKLTYSGGLIEEYKAVGKSNTEKQSTSKGNFSTELNKSKAKIQNISNDVAQKVSAEEFNDYVKKTDKEIDSKIGIEDVEKLVKQKAESWNLSIDGKLKGNTYLFDGVNFSIGSNENGDIAEHNNRESLYYHDDGTYTKMSSKGLERYINDKAIEYNYLNYMGLIWVDSGIETRINIPDEFKNKPYKVLISIVSINGESMRSNMRLNSFYLSENVADSTGISVTAMSYYTWTDENNEEHYGQCGRILLSYILTL